MVILNKKKLVLCDLNQSLKAWKGYLTQIFKQIKQLFYLDCGINKFNLKFAIDALLTLCAFVYYF